MSSASTLSTLQEFYATESAKIRQRFEASGDGHAALSDRSTLVDIIAIQLYRHFFSSEGRWPENFCLVALGGFGRRVLFPYSDIDILFLCVDARTEALYKEGAARICQSLWDLRLRVSPTTRTLAECGRLHRENLEFNIALLDSRYLAGDAQLFAHLRQEVLPGMITRERRDLVRNLAELTRHRHAKYGNTIFHLEPNVKEVPGGLRDYQVACWLAVIAAVGERRRWAEPEGLLPPTLRDRCRAAFDFLSATRSFLHYGQGRDDNVLTYELQAEAASLGIGHPLRGATTPGDWMRSYFRHARSIERLAAQLLDEVRPARSSLYEAFEDWRSRLSNPDFSVIGGQIFLRQPAALNDPAVLMNLFEFMARHGLRLSAEAERRVEEALPSLVPSVPQFAGLWAHIRQILVLPHAADALRAMHRLGVLILLFPEFQAIDSLVVRDFYHRYTVDEHSFMTIENLHRLRKAKAEWEQRYAEILGELEQPELLFLSLLFHDIGKGMPVEDHLQGSLQAFGAIAPRLKLDPTESETVQFLIARHLEMSATLLRRDIFDPETVRAFAERVGTPERLKLLCLFTYADIQAVNPEALTPWKAEMLWQLYAATANDLSRSVDEERLHTGTLDMQKIEQIVPLLRDSGTSDQLRAFLDGLPKRYLASRSPAEIANHFQMACQLALSPVQVELVKRRSLHELTLLTLDRVSLFATIAGTLAAWGMNIVKAEAFANRAGIVLDTFHFADLFRTLELNPPERERFKMSLVDVLEGNLSLQSLLQGRVRPRAVVAPKVRVETELRFEDACSSHSTLLELIAQDCPGLLYEVSSVLAGFGCNIEVALIDTEGGKAMDVFYLTIQGAKLDAGQELALRDALLQRL